MDGFNRTIRKSRISSAGMSLVEMLMTMFVVFILAAALLWTIIAGKTMVQSSTTRITNQDQLQRVSSMIGRDLKYSNVNSIATITVGTVPAPPALANVQAISFLSAFDDSGNFVTYINGLPVWQRYVIYYVLPNTKSKLPNTFLIYRKEVKVHPPGVAVPMDKYTQITGYTTDLNGNPISLSSYSSTPTGQRFSSSITRFSFLSDIVSNSATFLVTIQGESIQGKIDMQSKQMKNFLLN